jgi:hypothetical protein
MAGMPPNFMFSTDKKYDLFRGAVMENYVLSEIISSTKNVPYYWRSGSDAEMDFVAQIDGMAVPIEAKAGNDKSKSLVEFIKRYGSEVAVITSNRNTKSNVITYVPKYSVWNIVERLRGKLQKNH